MEYKFGFLKKFSAKMLVLAVFTGFIIMTSMPLAYFKFALSDKEVQASLHGKQIAAYMSDAVKETPLLWYFNTQKFLKAFSEPELKAITVVRILDEGGNLLRTENVSQPSLFTISTRYGIKYNNVIYGFVEIDEKYDDIINNTIFLIIGFTLLGSLVGFTLYKFPTQIVAHAEKDTMAALRKLNNLSFYDSLTDLSNRAKMQRDLNNMIKAARETGSKVAVMFLDLDRFKYVNDIFGHCNGDILLKAVAERLLEYTRKGEVVARLGGDEFVILVPNFARISQIQERARDIINGLSESFVLNGNEVFITTSVGISIFPTDGTDVDSLLRQADAAMYNAKQQGKNMFCFYDRELHNSLAYRFRLERGLRKAVERNEFAVHYQPIINARTGDCMGAEALVRWNHPELGMLMPSEFIRIAEETGLIIPIGEFVLKTACRQNKAWQKQGLPPMFISVNLSAYQFGQSSLEGLVARTLQQAQLSPQWLMLEITESMAMYNEVQFLKKLNGLKKMGVRIAIDDFGTGYCSLNYLKELPADVLKIDRTFIRDLAVPGAKEAAIINAIVALTKSFNMEIIAEGVETKKQREQLLSLSCPLMQGYLFARPLPADKFAEMLSHWQKKVV